MSAALKTNFSCRCCLLVGNAEVHKPCDVCMGNPRTEKDWHQIVENRRRILSELPETLDPDAVIICEQCGTRYTDNPASGYHCPKCDWWNPPPASPTAEKESVLSAILREGGSRLKTDVFDEELQDLVVERGNDYGHPLDDFAKVSAIKGAVASCPDLEVRHALEMIGVKMARLAQTPDHLDSIIDIAGYARCIAMILDERAARAEDDNQASA